MPTCHSVVPARRPGPTSVGLMIPLTAASSIGAEVVGWICRASSHKGPVRTVAVPRGKLRISSIPAGRRSSAHTACHLTTAVVSVTALFAGLLSSGSTLAVLVITDLAGAVTATTSASAVGDRPGSGLAV